jgi:hypothetical protein
MNSPQPSVQLETCREGSSSGNPGPVVPISHELSKGEMYDSSGVNVNRSFSSTVDFDHTGSPGEIQDVDQDLCNLPKSILVRMLIAQRLESQRLRNRLAFVDRLWNQIRREMEDIFAAASKTPSTVA